MVDVLVARAACSSRTKSKKHCKQVIVVYSAIAICIAYDPSVKQEGFFSAGICPQNGLPVATTPQRPTPVEDRLLPFSAVGEARRAGADTRYTGAAGAGAGGQSGAQAFSGGQSERTVHCIGGARGYDGGK